MADLGFGKAMAGLIGSFTLVAAAVGGILFGMIADRYGRTRALIGSILIYSVFTGACGLAQTAWHLMLFRALLGIGMGGEWASGAALVSETWPAEHRGKALGDRAELVGGRLRGRGHRHRSWCCRSGAGARCSSSASCRRWSTAWVRRSVKEPEVWQKAQRRRRRHGRRRGRLAEIFRGPMLRLTVFVTLMNACTLYAYWAFTQWVPAYLELSPARGGLGLGSYKTLLVVAMNVGMWFGYVTFGLVSDRLGRKRTYVTYVLAAAFFVMAYASFRTPLALLALGPFVGFFGAGYFSGFGAVTAEIYPTSIRATAQGFTYNLGRIASAAAPWTVGTLADSRGFPTAFATAAVGVRPRRRRVDLDPGDPGEGDRIASGCRDLVVGRS